MYATLTSLVAVGMAATGRYGGVVYALHHSFISCEGLARVSSGHGYVDDAE